jgi:hypothetical protein
MNVQIVGNSGFDLIEKLAELCGAMASIALADDPAGCDVEGGEQRCGAMARVFKFPLATNEWALARPRINKRGEVRPRLSVTCLSIPESANSI